jgi:hypothetical protein
MHAARFRVCLDYTLETEKSEALTTCIIAVYYVLRLLIVHDDTSVLYTDFDIIS